jgi:hypothetical protein
MPQCKIVLKNYAMATFKSRVLTVNTRSSILSFADLEAVTVIGKRSSRAQSRTVPTSRRRARRGAGIDVPQCLKVTVEEQAPLSTDPRN